MDFLISPNVRWEEAFSASEFRNGTHDGALGQGSVPPLSPKHGADRCFWVCSGSWFVIFAALKGAIWGIVGQFSDMMVSDKEGHAEMSSER